MLKLETERETDGRWIAEIVQFPGVLAYGDSREEAVAKVEALALRVLADRLEHGEDVPEVGGLFARMTLTLPLRGPLPLPQVGEGKARYFKPLSSLAPPGRGSG
jgi:predicted RNase H-like HicB family nuclease